MSLKYPYPKAKQLGQTPNNGGNFSVGQPSMIVMHYTAAGSGVSSARYLFSPHSPSSSAHFVVDRDGTVYQLSDLNKKTWHAGISSWKDRLGRAISGINSYGIGIEIANWGYWRDDISKYVPDPAKAGWLKARHPNGGPELYWERYPEAQMKAVEELTAWLLTIFPAIWTEVGHDQIAPARKSDPGPAFPWARIKAIHAKVRGKPVAAAHPTEIAALVSPPAAQVATGGNSDHPERDDLEPISPEDRPDSPVEEDLSKDTSGDVAVKNVMWYKSKFFWGLGVSVIFKILALGFNITPQKLGLGNADIQEIATLVTLIASFVGDAIMTRGRVTAVDSNENVARQIQFTKKAEDKSSSLDKKVA